MRCGHIILPYRHLVRTSHHSNVRAYAHNRARRSHDDIRANTHEVMMSESLMSAALRYAQLGYAVFPCAPGRKVPMVTNGRNAATTDAQQIEAWWQAAPRANIGISTDDLIVIDIDGSDNGWPHDGELGAQLASAATSMTPRGGRHHVYRQPQGRRGVRVRADWQTQSILEDGVATFVLSPVFCPVVHTDGCLGASWICPVPSYQCLHHGWLICSTA